jgi:hypothetical protein
MMLLTVGCGDPFGDGSTKTTTFTASEVAAVTVTPDPFEVFARNAVKDASGSGFTVLIGPYGNDDGPTHYSNCLEFCNQVLGSGSVSCAGPAVIGPNGVKFANGATFSTDRIVGTGDEAIRCDYQDQETPVSGCNKPPQF